MVVEGAIWKVIEKRAGKRRLIEIPVDGLESRVCARDRREDHRLRNHLLNHRHEVR